MKHLLKVMLLVMILFPDMLFAQLPFYYKIKKVSGELYQADGTSFNVTFINRRQLDISGCSDPRLDTLLRELTFTRLSRKYLEHLLTTAAQISVEVTDKIGLDLEDGKYWLIAGLSGPDDSIPELIKDSTSNFKPRNIYKRPYKVYKRNTIRLFRGSIFYYYDSTMKLDQQNVFLFDFKNNKRIMNFSMDTIRIEPIMYPDLMYRNMKELYYFAGTHEIFHTTPLSIRNTDAEELAFKLERKLFKKRKAINRKKNRIP